jgi:hypothetical protein
MQRSRWLERGAPLQQEFQTTFRVRLQHTNVLILARTHTIKDLLALSCTCHQTLFHNEHGCTS